MERKCKNCLYYEEKDGEKGYVEDSLLRFTKVLKLK
jgi:hypothetical protein